MQVPGGCQRAGKVGCVRPAEPRRPEKRRALGPCALACALSRLRRVWDQESELLY